MSIPNKKKTPPKRDVKFSLTLSEEQKQAKSLILNSPFNFVLGAAGSGKTLLACQIALDLYFKRQIDQIIITRPTISTEDIGFLPGSEAEKMEPWLVPIRSNFYKIYSHKNTLEKMESENQIEIVSLTHFRGRTFDNALVIIDEFQNLTKQQLSMVLGRLGRDSKMILCGDLQQIDLKYQNDSAIHEVSKLKGSQYVNEIILKENHRHPALAEIFELLYKY